ncbi:UDP-N-acetylglucosamine pyrophosphorylase [Ordospora colligata]|uniref:UDP-N-acetylglucosamine diphosphorylase n=1 Tax=Ordospora colligata OC4 TaxID=1354746 RepID=A0A0B2UI81_9MICR|nr:UDP-N-acetylglucosamine pyrophosphorylase [Ordospora colligata OC4]KHN68944.1 UDP-N-acetylglucosamine pyrophosphorylase [Ordospora colligata OC4]TBU13978.1 UDP-N-acetylglucosamine pyrophosphorylase [Ordospora colligata]TBU14167.1 UDP-N-acetylglucosamine pyrophosphorylase [Ordospora colligata]TBU17836.1 UDP-N-acetylglucosamine pyrophosphorylase [Ordospora colligata]
MGYVSMNSVNLIKPYDGFELNDDGMKYKKMGEDILRSKSLGVVILSGGQGTRLGITQPKGLFTIKGKTLFEWHMERIQELVKSYCAKISVFVMTSSFTDKEVKEYFQKRDFGLSIQFFMQSNSVSVDVNGKPLQCFGKDIESPYGNGDIFKAIQQVSLEGIDALNVISIDNVLAKILDPVFVGAFYSREYDVLSKSVTKGENESVGAFLMSNSKLVIREYSESVGDSSGECGIQGNICNHIFKTSFVKSMRSVDLKEHKAFKAIPYSVGNELIKPSSPNGYKKETFIFDCFEYTDKNGVMNVPREKEFSPLKNGQGSVSDNPMTCTFAVEKHRSEASS